MIEFVSGSWNTRQTALREVARAARCSGVSRIDAGKHVSSRWTSPAAKEHQFAFVTDRMAVGSEMRFSSSEPDIRKPHHGV
jgi:hypothetical protein